MGGVATAWFVHLAGTGALNDGGFGASAVAVAHAKAELPLVEAFARGVLCNALVCLAVWLAMGGRSVSDKVLGIVLPITAFVALGFEHSIANWFFLPWAWLEGAHAEPEFLAGAARNLAAVTAGNVLGGSLLVAGIYWLAYLRPSGARD